MWKRRREGERQLAVLSTTTRQHKRAADKQGYTRTSFVREDVRNLPQLIVQVHGAHSHGVVPGLSHRRLDLGGIFMIHAQVPLHEPLLSLSCHLHRHIPARRQDTHDGGGTDISWGNSVGGPFRSQTTNNSTHRDTGMKELLRRKNVKNFSTTCSHEVHQQRHPHHANRNVRWKHPPQEQRPSNTLGLGTHTWPRHAPSQPTHRHTDTHARPHTRDRQTQTRHAP